MNLSPKQKIGRMAESKAREFLQKNGMTLLKANYTCYVGEIDLIMQDKDTIVFVEVRYRSDNYRFGTALESINDYKIAKIIRAAQHFLQYRGWMYKKNSRFDIIAIHPKNAAMQVDWVKNAFTVDR